MLPHRHGLQDLLDNVGGVSLAVVASLHDPAGATEEGQQTGGGQGVEGVMMSLCVEAGLGSHLSKSSPPVTSSRTSAMSVSVSKISFSWI